MFKLTPKEQKLVLLLVCLLVLGIVLRFALPAGGRASPEIILHGDMESNAEHGNNGDNGNGVEEKKLIIIHITGAVQEPGVYILEEGARVYEAVEKAGGQSDDADLEMINLAEPLYDGQPVYVPRKSDRDPSQISGGIYPGGLQQVKGGKININSADKSQLETLPGIGAVKAQSIIDYREKNGPFKSVDDLLKVTGIGGKTLESLGDLITVY